MLIWAAGINGNVPFGLAPEHMRVTENGFRKKYLLFSFFQT
jgi:hypothetical protein